MSAAVQDALVVGAVRTPVGRLGGALSAIRPDDLAAHAIRALVSEAGVDGAEVEDVVLGCANQAGEDNRDMARMAALLADLPESVGGTTINRLCGSGLDAVAGAARMLMLGEGELYVAGGVESMSRASWAVPKPAKGFATGATTMHDSSLGWRFVNPEMERRGHTDPLGRTAENLADERWVAPDEADDAEGAARRPPLRRLARRAGHLRTGQPSQGRGGAGGGPVRRRDHRGDGDRTARGADRRGRRGPAGPTRRSSASRACVRRSPRPAR